MAWRRFFLQLLAVIVGGVVVLLAALVALDPWGMGWRALPGGPADRSQRWAYPEMARDGGFDAAVIGNSTARLLDPALLGPALGARAINLAMVKAYPYEQARLLDVFLRAHPAARAVLIGIDRSWCETGAVPRFGYDPIPEWLYDGDRAAGLLHLFNMHAIVTAWRSLGVGLGWTPPAYARNGFTLIDVDARPYDPALAQRLIADGLAEPWPALSGAEAAAESGAQRYPGLDLLAARLAAVPAGTRVLLAFVPRYHLYSQPGSDGAAMIAECKRRVAAMARGRAGTEVYDMAFANPVTEDATRWWDVVHARPETMAVVSRALAAAIGGIPDGLVHVLVAGPSSVSAR